MATSWCYHSPVSRYRMYPTAEQEKILLKHCEHARAVWNIGNEQRLEYRPGRGPTPGYAEQNRQLTAARDAEPWLATGSAIVQQQALRDLDRAWQNFFAGTHRRPTWRKAGLHESFRIVGKATERVRQLNRRWSAVFVPKAGWVHFRRSRPVPVSKSYRIKRDRAGRWHIAFTALPNPIVGPATGEVVGIDRGIAVTLALSTGETHQVPPARDMAPLHRRLSRAKRGSNRRQRAKGRLARGYARNADRRKDWVEKASTDIARRFDVIRIEDLKIRNMTRSAKGTIERPGKNVRQKAGLNRAILHSSWGVFAERLEQKAPGRVEKVRAAYTSLTCNACGHCAEGNRKSQAFLCLACGHRDHADVNAAKNIAVGHTVTARGGGSLERPVNREPTCQPFLAQETVALWATGMPICGT